MAEYTDIAESALKHWSGFDLVISDMEDRKRARFSYKGSTCTNGGRAFGATLFVDIKSRQRSPHTQCMG